MKVTKCDCLLRGGAAGISLALLLTLTACGMGPAAPAGDTAVPADGPAEIARPAALVRGDLAYGEMPYEHYDPAAFAPLLKPIERASLFGGAQETFDSACEAAEKELREEYGLPEPELMSATGGAPGNPGGGNPESEEEDGADPER